MVHKEYEKWKSSVKSGRLGQNFCNDFIRGECSELFYEANEEKADMMIKEWLTKHHYYATMPPKLKRTK